MIAIAGLRFQGRRVIERYEVVARPTRRLSNLLLRTLAIDPADLDDAATFTEAVPALRAFLGDYPLIGHGIRTTIEFLSAELSRINAPGFSNAFIELADFVSLNQMVLSKPTIVSVARELGLEHTSPGRPSADARVTAQIAVRLIERAGLDIPELLEPSGLGSRTGPAYRQALLEPGLARRVSDGPGVYTFHDHAGEVLYAGSASSLSRRLASYQSKPLALERGLDDLAERVWDVRTAPTEGLLEALVEENRLIKDLAPPFNVQRTLRMPR